MWVVRWQLFWHLMCQLAPTCHDLDKSLSCYVWCIKYFVRFENSLVSSCVTLFCTHKISVPFRGFGSQSLHGAVLHDGRRSRQGGVGCWKQVQNRGELWWHYSSAGKAQPRARTGEPPRQVSNTSHTWLNFLNIGSDENLTQVQLISMNSHAWCHRLWLNKTINLLFKIKQKHLRLKAFV